MSSFVIRVFSEGPAKLILVGVVLVQEAVLGRLEQVNTSSHLNTPLSPGTCDPHPGASVSLFLAAALHQSSTLMPFSLSSSTKEFQLPTNAQKPRTLSDGERSPSCFQQPS